MRNYIVSVFVVIQVLTCASMVKPIYSQSLPPDNNVQITDPGIEFVYVKGGCYKMGSDRGENDEKPAHNVCLSDFYIGKFEVTQKQWQKVMGFNPDYIQLCGPDCPISPITWNDTQRFIERLNSNGKVKFRLPTEAEWEYAARSGGRDETFTVTNSDEAVNDYAWHYNNSKDTMPNKVGLKKPNNLGLYDMLGNAWEWCQDEYSESFYKNSPKNNPVSSGNSLTRVLRGGSAGSQIMSIRTTKRSYDENPDNPSGNAGFRIVREIAPPVLPGKP